MDHKPPAQNGRPEGPGIAGVDGGWTRLRVVEVRGIAAVHFVGIALTNEIEILEVDRELGRLIERGYHRITLNFGNVVHLSTQVLGVVLKAARRCTAEGGRLKLCQIHPNVVEIFALTGLHRAVEIYPTEPEALSSAWPVSSRPAIPLGPIPEPKAVRITSPRPGAVRKAHPAAPPDRSADASPSIPLDEGDVPASWRPTPRPLPPPASPPSPPPADDPRVSPPGRRGNAAVVPTPGGPPTARAVHPPPPPALGPRRVRLIVLRGRNRGQIIDVPGPSFLVGRDPCCHLRSVSPQVRRVQAIIEQRGGRVFLRDVGACGTTAINDRPLRDEEAELGDDDRIQVGPMQFICCLGTAATPAPPPATAVSAPRPQLLGRPSDPSPDPLPQQNPAFPRHGADGPVTFEQVLPRILEAIGRALIQTSPALLEPPIRQGDVSPAVGPASAPPHLEQDRLPSQKPGMRSVSPTAPVDRRSRETSSPPRSVSPAPEPPAPLDDPAPAASGPWAERGEMEPGPGPEPPGIPGAWRVLGPEVGDAAAPPSVPRRALVPSPVEVPIFLPEAAESDIAAALDLEAKTDPNATDEEIPILHDLPSLEEFSPPAAGREDSSRPAPASPRLELDFVCPKCGSPGWIPVDKLDRQFQCKVCRAKLYTDVSDGLRIGEIPPPSQAEPEFVPRGPDLLDRSIDRWKALPRATRLAVKAAAVLLALGVARWFMTAPQLPESLRDRAVFVAEAFAFEDYRRLRAITAPGGDRDVDRWMERVRPSFHQGSIGRVWVKVKVQQQDQKTGKATLLAHLVLVSDPPALAPGKGIAAAVTPDVSAGRAAGAPATAGAGNHQIDLMLCWTRDRDGRWLFDGPKTLSTVLGPSRRANLPPMSKDKLIE